MLHRMSGRVTYDVDSMDELPDELLNAAASVAESFDLDVSWLNDSAFDVVPTVGPASTYCLYRGNRLEVYCPDAKFMLSTKTAAGRVKDLDDAVV